jgi:hypothetical protein
MICKISAESEAPLLFLHTLRQESQQREESDSAVYTLIYAKYYIRGPLRLVNASEELLGRNSSGSGIEI